MWRRRSLYQLFQRLPDVPLALDVGCLRRRSWMMSLVVSSARGRQIRTRGEFGHSTFLGSSCVSFVLCNFAFMVSDNCVSVPFAKHEVVDEFLFVFGHLQFLGLFGGHHLGPGLLCNLFLLCHDVFQLKKFIADLVTIFG